MHRFSAAALGAALLLLCPRSAPAQAALTLDQALAIARERSPSIHSARFGVEEARGRLAGASALLRENPVFEGAAGYRSQPAASASIERRLALTQVLELGGQRAARISAAQAQVSRAAEQVDEASRRLSRAVSLTFFGVLHAEERARLAASGEEAFTEVLRGAERRHQTGEIPRLEVNFARAALSRARAELRAREADRRAALGELSVLLGLGPDEPLAVRGDLRAHRRFELGPLVAGASRRPELRALEAEAREAEADRRLGEAQRWPDLEIGAAYERDGNADVGLGVVSLSLPVFQHGQGLRAAAGARERRASLELEAGLRAVAVEVRTAFEVLERRQAATRELEEHALVLLEEAEAQLRRSYAAGQLGLPELLAARRELVETRVEYLDRLLEEAIAGVELQASAGVTP